MVDPHGGKLVNRVAEGAEREALLAEAGSWPRVTVTARQASDLEMIAVGAFSPLEGFMAESDYWNVLHHMRLANWLPWTLPVTLAVDREQARNLHVADSVGLVDEEGRLLAELHLSQLYTYDKAQEARLAYGTEDPAHPGVAALYRQGDILLAGRIALLDREVPEEFAPYWLDPARTRQVIAERGWTRVVGFQTRNPVHRAHEYIQKCALETVDGLLLHPLVGETKADDIPADVRMRCYEVLIESYYPRGRVLLSVLPAAMRYAGPREAVFHAIIRKNYGCTHFIVGRDHAGVGSYYGPFDAQAIFDEFEPGQLGITPMFFDNSFWCRGCGSMATEKTCPHGAQERVSLSGTAVRKMLDEGQPLPEEFTRPEVARLLVEAMGRVPELSRQ